jgi:hypothetical protein
VVHRLARSAAVPAAPLPPLPPPPPETTATTTTPCPTLPRSLSSSLAAALPYHLPPGTTSAHPGAASRFPHPPSAFTAQRPETAAALSGALEGELAALLGVGALPAARASSITPRTAGASNAALAARRAAALEAMPPGDRAAAEAVRAALEEHLAGVTGGGGERGEVGGGGGGEGGRPGVYY